MTIAENLWLRGQAAQRDLVNLTSYNTVFAGTAALQALHMGLTMPQSFWAAMARAAAGATATAASAAADAPASPVYSAEILAFKPEESAKPADRAPEAPPASAVIDLAPADQPPAPEAALPDDLTTLAGVGPKLARALHDLGIHRFDQIAALDADAIAGIEARQKGFRMICARHDLVGQARARV